MTATTNNANASLIDARNTARLYRDELVAALEIERDQPAKVPAKFVVMSSTMLYVTEKGNGVSGVLKARTFTKFASRRFIESARAVDGNNQPVVLRSVSLIDALNEALVATRNAIATITEFLGDAK